MFCFNFESEFRALKYNKISVCDISVYYQSKAWLQVQHQSKSSSVLKAVLFIVLSKWMTFQSRHMNVSMYSLYQSVRAFVCVCVCVVSQGRSQVSGRNQTEGRRLARATVQGATVPLSPPCISHMLIYILFSFPLPSKLPCGACWHGISLACTQSPLVLSVLELERVSVCVPARMCVCVLICAYMRMLGTHFCSPTPPSSYTRVTVYEIPQPSPAGQKERQLL